MRPSVPEYDDGLVWDVARPKRASRIPGVIMAGFRDRGMVPLGHRLIPHPTVTLALDFGALPPIVDHLDGRQYRGSLVAGVGLGGAVWGRSGDLACVQVRLSPVIAGAILGTCLSDLDCGVVVMGDLLGKEAAQIGERLGEAHSWEDRFSLTDAWLAGRRAAGPAVDREVAWAWDRIAVSRGLVRVDRLASEIGWSRKRLWSRFQSQIGLPPKRAAKLVRFDHAAHRLVAGEGAARVAANGGYTDQSHLHRDVVAFTGVTPATLAGEPFLAVDDIAWTSHGTPAPASGG